MNDLNKSYPVVFLLVGFASIFIISWGIKASAVVLNPILLAAVITVVVLPMPQKFIRRGLPTWLSFVVTLLIVVGSIAAVIFLVFISFSNMVDSFANETSSMSQLAALSPAIRTVIPGLVGFIGRTTIQGFFVMLIFTFMLSAAIMNPNLNLGTGTASIMTQISALTTDVRRYMSIMTGVNLMVGLGDVLLLWIVGVDYALIWGLLSWIMGYIPTVGFWIALIPPVLLAYSTLGLQTAVIVFLGYVLINGSVQNFIQPRMMGQGLGISPVIVFISLFVWGWLLGGIGAILAVPLTMIIIAVLNNYENTRWLVTLISTPPEDEHKADERAKATQKMKNLWQQSKNFFVENGRESETIETAATARKESSENDG
jgi:AI-2 transport protein TqsA